MEFSFERFADDSPWGSEQPRFVRLVSEEPDRYFLVGRMTSGEPISIQLAAATLGPPSRRG